MNRDKIVLITNIPNQYRVPLFNELQIQLERQGKQFHVIFGAEGYDARKSIIDLSECKFSYEILTQGRLKWLEKKTGFLFYTGLPKRLKELDANHLIVAGYSLATIKIWWKSLFKKTNYFIWSGSISQKGKKQSFLRTFERKLLIKRAKGFIAYGSLAKEKFIELGASPHKVKAVGNTVDTSFFERETQKKRADMIASDKKYLTYIGYLTERKRVEELIPVMLELSKLRADFILEIIGDGANRKSLENLVRKNDLEEHIKFYGFQQKEQLPNFLARSNCFLFQTSFDIWGLVLNEAMAAGVPCLSSVYAGATEDLIEDGITGFKVNFANSNKVAIRINEMLNNPDDMKELSKKATSFIQSNYSLSTCAKRIIAVFDDL